MDDFIWLLPIHVLDKVCEDLQIIIFELQIQYKALPYLIATYKKTQKEISLVNKCLTRYVFYPGTPISYSLGINTGIGK